MSILEAGEGLFVPQEARPPARRLFCPSTETSTYSVTTEEVRSLPFPQRAARLIFPLVVLMATLALAAAPALASDDNRGPGGGERDEDEGVVAVSLTDVTNAADPFFAIRVNPGAVEKKKVTFNVKNNSARIPHQFKVIKTDLPPDALPRLGPGQGVDESKVDIVAQFGAPGADTIAAQQSAVVAAKLKKGNYVLICNLNPTSVPRRSHYDDGMRVGFRVGHENNDDDD
jgi:hypothetical protein